MSGGPPPPFYGFSGQPGAPQYPGQYFPGAQFPSAPYPGAPPQYPGSIPTHFPPMTQSFPNPGQTTSNYYPTGETHFTSSFQPQSHTSFTPVSGPKWVHWSKGQMLPAHAVLGGRDCDGTSIYVGRIHHKKDLIPAKVLPMKHVAYVSYDGKEIPYTSCEILCQERVNWAPSVHGNVPPGAIPVGHTSHGETLYAARFHHNGSLTVGKLHPSHRTCYIPFGGKEVSNPSYEVLTG